MAAAPRLSRDTSSAVAMSSELSGCARGATALVNGVPSAVAILSGNLGRHEWARMGRSVDSKAVQAVAGTSGPSAKCSGPPDRLSTSGTVLRVVPPEVSLARRARTLPRTGVCRRTAGTEPLEPGSASRNDGSCTHAAAPRRQRRRLLSSPRSSHDVDRVVPADGFCKGQQRPCDRPTLVWLLSVGSNVGRAGLATASSPLGSRAASSLKCEKRSRC